jgi:UrcA family protein
MGALAEPIEYYTTVTAQAEARSKVVSYRDLNLQRHEGAATLYRRIETAASLVCSEPNARMPQVTARIRNCASDATSRAVAEVGAPMLAAIHSQRTATAQTTLVAGRSR